MELKEGMYVRTDKGYIFKIKEFKKHYTKGTRKLDFCKVIQVEENYLLLDGKQCEFIESVDYSIPPCYPSDEELEKIKSNILKASYNIIDLIEEKDFCEIEFYSERYKERVKRIFEVGYVARGEQSHISFENAHCQLDIINGEWSKHDKCLNPKIKSIVTKEQFESMSYEIN